MQRKILRFAQNDRSRTGQGQDVGQGQNQKNASSVFGESVFLRALAAQSQ
ncbi:MAG: hypothetical protein RSD32_07345 [Oscillospiraceae bacterium]